MPEPDETESNRETDPEALGRALEMELIMKRAAWQRMRARRGTWRALIFLFLLVVILGALFAWFYFSSALPRPGREEQSPGAAETGR